MRDTHEPGISESQLPEVVPLKGRRRFMKRVILASLLSVWVQGGLWGQSVTVGTSDQIPAETPVNLYLCPPCVPWNSTTTAHLMRRAGFSASPEDLNRWK